MENDPKKVFTNFIAPNFGLEFNQTGISLFVGAEGRHQIIPILAVEGSIHYDFVNVGGKAGGFLFEVGGFMPLFSKERKKEIPIILDYNPHAGTVYKNGKTYNVEQTKFIKIPGGKYLNKYGIRTGLHQRKLFTENDEINSIKANGHISITGIYIGGQVTSQAYLKAKLNGEEERHGAGFTRLYADAMLFPDASLSTPDILPSVKKKNSLGWRVGFQWYISPHDGKHKFFSNSIFGSEIAQRPYGGLMFRGYWAFSIYKSRS